MAFGMPGAGTFEQRGGWLARQLVAEFGLADFQAAGLVGNLGYESRGFTALQEEKPAVSGSAGGYGIGQWTGPRRRAFEAWCTARHLPMASDEANVGYLLEELHGAYNYTIYALKKTTTIEQATFSVGQTYERPGGTTPDHLPGYVDRLAWARRALAGGRMTVQPMPPIPAPKVIASPASVRARMESLQEELDALGYDTGKPRGIWGPMSKAAIDRFEAEN